MTFERHFEPEIELKRRMGNVRTALVVAARWQRSDRWRLRADWGNGIVSGRSTARYRSDIEVTQQRWGGGWQSTLEVGGDVRLAARARMTVTWFTSGEGRLEDDSPH